MGDMASPRSVPWPLCLHRLSTSLQRMGLGWGVPLTQGGQEHVFKLPDSRCHWYYQKKCRNWTEWSGGQGAPSRSGPDPLQEALAGSAQASPLRVLPGLAESA